MQTTSVCFLMQSSALTIGLFLEFWLMEGSVCSFTAVTVCNLGCDSSMMNACCMKVKWPITSWLFFPISWLLKPWLLKKSFYSFHPHQTLFSHQMSLFTSTKDKSPSFTRICFNKLFYKHNLSNGFDRNACTTMGTIPFHFLPPCGNLKNGTDQPLLLHFFLLTSFSHRNMRPFKFFCIYLDKFTYLIKLLLYFKRMSSL